MKFPGRKAKLESDEKYLDIAITCATTSVTLGGGPFGALVVTADGAVFASSNSVTLLNDPTAHAEVQAIRLAASRLETFDLSGCVLFSSCEPCPMCRGAALWARVERVVYAANRYDAARAGFDDAAFYTALETASGLKEMRVTNAVAPFDAWAAKSGRTEY